MARVKEHIYRAHKLIVCVRCQHEFNSQKLYEAHQRADVACERRPEIPHEGITLEQEKKLKSRKEAHQGKSPEDQWRSAYRILFPAEEPPSPYYEELDGDAYQAFLGQELPARVADGVKPLLSDTHLAGEFYTRLTISDISNVVRNCLKSVSHSFRYAPTTPEEQCHNPGSSIQRPLLLEAAPELQNIILTAGPREIEAAQILVAGAPGLSEPGSDTVQNTEAMALDFSLLANDPLHFEDLASTACFCVPSCDGPCDKWDFSPEAWGMGSEEILDH
ncbi:hypothetical protein GQ53DRAFT_740202 [Thozetella sp. PMI_491]|nr:hypothetical protein GQ53DRAFT_740202 [Thozetella sp. PMI_491]